ncbi:TetR family transcriptional regulator [Nocardia sp. NEAU-G5]|uniref:TetR family transcriptional regulator n=1 Tax=Nocardia albiluteola TaxID=2842303 RepID=A0ABS6B1X0_9NOCA|nr:TetR/AcrR family transcriptional regulator [Nocardia albiluteola]MBU3064293.1 TetR family transcriptional regulator [Nocardia albiluteola]
MARIAEVRSPAAPVSERQMVRRERILDAAAELGSAADYDRVQMVDVAKAAGVAIGTLYRYFPSKTHLFAALFDAKIGRFLDARWATGGPDPIAELGENLVALNRELLRTPRLCGAMLQAAAGTYMTGPTEDGLMSQTVLPQAILRTLTELAPDRANMDVIRLLVYSWWGVLVSALGHKTSPRRAEDDVRLATRLLLADYAR